MKKIVADFIREKGYPRVEPKAVLFDMDGVLFDSMKYHAGAWYRTIKEQNIECEPADFYMYEGCTGAYTINQLFQRSGRGESTLEEQQAIYALKSAYFNEYPEPLPMEGAQRVVEHVVEMGLTPIVVTGSGQLSLIGRLEVAFPGVFPREQVVCAFDVVNGKPDPEPYLKGLAKAGVEPYEAIVVENAPMGVKASSSAGIFTIGVNTGPLEDHVLLDYGANIVLPSMSELADRWEEIIELFRKTRMNSSNE